MAGLALNPICVTPSDHVTFHGPVPVNAAEMLAEAPLQITALPLTAAVGRGLIVITALPLRSLPCAVHLESLNPVTV